MGIQAYNSATKRQDMSFNLIDSNDAHFSQLFASFKHRGAMRFVLFACTSKQNVYARTQAAENLLQHRIKMILEMLWSVKIGEIAFFCINSISLENHIVKEISNTPNCRGIKVCFGGLADETCYEFSGTLGKYQSYIVD